MTFSWRDSYRIGNAAIDAEHQELFRLANTFFDAADKASKTDCAVRLFQYTREHFDHEEMLMREIEYPAMAAHIEQHNVLISNLNDIAGRIANESLQSAQLKKFLTGWLVGHIVTFDTKLSVYISSKRKQARPESKSN